jgi:hypothetical protein
MYAYAKPDREEEEGEKQSFSMPWSRKLEASP